jgi:hypothetical protein
MTTQQLLQRLREGRLPADAEVCRDGTDTFRPVSAYPEFYEVQPLRDGAAKPARPSTDDTPPPATAEEDPGTKKAPSASTSQERKDPPAGSFGPHRHWTWWLLAVGLGALVASGVAAVCRSILVSV